MSKNVKVKYSSSKEEDVLYSLLCENYQDAEQGIILEDLRLAGKHLVVVDVYIPSLRVVVEYDGEYWHRKRQRADRRKSKALLRKGYRVVRVRQGTVKNPPTLLNIVEDGYSEVEFITPKMSFTDLLREILRLISDN